MKIHGVKLENFMLFDKLDAEFSPNVNIICGENSTGKTALIKLLYACATSCPEMAARRNFEKQLEVTERAKGFISLTHSDFGLCYLHLFRKLRDLFSLNNEEGIKYLSNLRTTNPARISLNFDGEESLRFSLTGDKRKITDNAVNDEFQVPNILFTEFDFAKIVYVPPKEMISSTENFASLYEEYHISFDETYYDLARLLDRPRKKALSPEMEKVAQNMEALIGGKVRQKGKAFYLDMDGVGELRMSLVSEGYRKLATLLNLVSTGSLSDGAILFWDEPETNMNPRMVEPLVKAILALAGAGVQVFVTTHDYFVQQYFGLAAEYGERFQAGTGNLEYRFLSLNKARTADGAETVTLESASRLEDLERNAVKEEFDAVYDREQGLIYGDDA